jgi:vancomycin resistance protein YoaR
MAKKKKKKKQLKKQIKKTTAVPKAKKKPASSSKKTAIPKKTKPKPPAKPKAAKPKPPARQEEKKQNKISQFIYKARTPIFITVILFALFVIFELSSIVVTYGFLNNTAPGTRVAGIDLSSLSADEAQNKLLEISQPFLDTPMKIRLDEQEVELPPSQLGVELDTDSTINNINFVRFDNSNLATILSTAWNNDDTPFQNTIDIELALANIEKEFNFDEQKTKNAYLAFEEGVLTVIPEKAGKNINVKKLFEDLKENASNLKNNTIEVSALNTAPQVNAADLETRLDEIKDKLNHQVTLNYENFNFNIKPIDYIDWIRFDYTDELQFFDLGESVTLNKNLTINILPELFNQYIDEKLSPILESSPEGVKIWRDEEGKVQFEGKGENGQTINRDHLLSALTLAINNKIDEVPIPIHLIPAEVEISKDLQDLGIKELIATGKSAFAGSTNNRIHNINTGIGKFQGHIIAPGETFSFNTILGPVEAYTGFVPELVIKPEGTIPEYGGGLCQVSSTMFRAALFAGLPIVERTPHSYAVSYYSQVYGYGLDATIYPGVHDVKFTNDTPGSILIQGYTEGINAYFKFYGTSDGRSVELEGPYIGGYRSPGPTQYIETPSLAPGQTKWMENAHTGFNANWFRHLTTAAGETIIEPLYTTYKAIPAKVLVGPGVGDSEGE